jgi:hypothetical protein
VDAHRVAQRWEETPGEELDALEFVEAARARKQGLEPV